MEERTIRITRTKLRRLAKDPQKTAEAVQLRYVSDSEPGIRRLTSKGTFIYKLGNRTIRDQRTLNRIRSLVIPPAWQEVWICTHPEGHLQATGLDARNRKQYRYHPFWTSLRNQTKYSSLYDFGRALPQIRSRLKQDLALPGLPLEKVLATVVSLMECTYIRIGNNAYEKQNGSYGLTTLKNKHVRIQGPLMRFSFKGKKGIYHDISLRSRKLSRIVQACRDIPGKELFQYYDEHGARRPIDSGMVNSYIKTISSGDFTAKDFRTWAGSLHALNAFRQLGCCDTENETKKRVVEAVDTVARYLGNTRSICRKYYIHPALIEAYSDRSLEKYLAAEPGLSCPGPDDTLTAEERVLMTILKTGSTDIVLK